MHLSGKGMDPAEPGKIILPTRADQRDGMSLYKLNNGFKGIYGMRVKDFLLEARMAKAHRELSKQTCQWTWCSKLRVLPQFFRTGV